MKLSHFSVSMLVVAASASVALAGTKYQTNLVPSSATSPPTPPTLSSKGQIKMLDTGKVQAKLKSVTVDGTTFVTTSTSYKDTKTLDGSEYIVILKANFAALGVPFESAIPVDLKNGNGVTNLLMSSLFALIPPGVGRSIDVEGAEVWGPLGTATLAACQAVVDTGYDLTPGDTACRQGTEIGVSGINIP